MELGENRLGRFGKDVLICLNVCCDMFDLVSHVVLL